MYFEDTCLWKFLCVVYKLTNFKIMYMENGTIFFLTVNFDFQICRKVHVKVTTWKFYLAVRPFSEFAK